MLVHSGQSFISFQHLPRSCKGESVKSNDIYILHICARESFMLVASTFPVFFVLFSPLVLNVVSSEHSFWDAPHLCLGSDHLQNVVVESWASILAKGGKSISIPSPPQTQSQITLFQKGETSNSRKLQGYHSLGSVSHCQRE